MTKKYIKDYDLIDNVPVYKGILYKINISQDELKKIKLFILLNTFVSALLFFAAGFTGNNATRVPYVGVPYMLLIIPVVYACMDACKFITPRERMERVHYEGSFLHMHSWAVAKMLFSAAAAVGDIIYLAITQSPSLNEYLFLPLVLLLFFSSYIFYKKIRIVKSNISHE